MNKKDKLSVVITTFNSEDKIEDCLKSVSFADEVIVVDGSSTDKTVDKIRKYTKKVFIRPNHPMLNVNKNFGFSKATGSWIFCVDSDEMITKELAQEIKAEVQKAKEDDGGFWIPRKNIIFGKWIEHAGWYPDYQLRLFKKGKGEFPEEHVHEIVKVDGGVGYLKNNILHSNYESISQFLGKLTNLYGPNEAEQLIKNGYIFDWRDAIRFPVKEFLSRYFARGGYKDGLHGLVLSLLMAFYHLVVFCFVWEKYKFRDINDRMMLSEVEKEAAQSSRDMFLWFSKEKAEFIKNPVIKNLYKALRKFKS